MAQCEQLGLERAGLVAEPVLAQPHDLGEGAQLRRLVIGPLGLPQRQLGEPLVLCRGGVDRAQDVGGGDAQIEIVERGLDGGERLGVLGFRLQHECPAIERLDRPRERTGEQLGDLDVQCELLVAMGERGLPLADIDQVGMTLGGAVEARELDERTGVLAVAIEDLEPCADRLVALVELALVDLGDAREQRDVLLVVRDVDLAAEDVDQVAPARGRLEQTLERVQRAGIARLIGEHVAPGGDRGLLVAQPLLLELRHAGEQRAPLAGILGPLRLPARDAAQLRPALLLLVEACERRAGAPDRRRRGRIGLEQPLIRGDRVRCIPGAALRVVVRRELGEQRGAGAGVVLGRRGDGRLERRGGLGPALERLREPGELHAGALVRGLEPQHLEPGVERVARAGELGLLEHGDPREQLDGLGPTDERALRTQHGREVLPQLVVLVERLEQPRHAHLHRARLRIGEQLLEQLARIRVVAMLAEHVLDQIDGAARILRARAPTARRGGTPARPAAARSRHDRCGARARPRARSTACSRCRRDRAPGTHRCSTHRARARGDTHRSRARRRRASPPRSSRAAGARRASPADRA